MPHSPTPPPEDPFSYLSHRLISHGYLTRPLLLETFLHPLPSLPSSSSSSSSSLKRYQESLLLRARAQDQVTKLLWSLVERNEESRDELRESVEREGRVQMEFEREQSLREREERERESLARELEKERAKTKELETKLKLEQDRSKTLREESLKHRNALQFIKTQSLHDQKKREQEVNQLHSRLSKLTSSGGGGQGSIDSMGGGTRVVVLNRGSVGSPTSGSPTTVFGSSTLGGGARRLRNNLSTPPTTTTTTTTNEQLSLFSSELELLKTSLVELEETRSFLTRENFELRGFLGELGDWVEGLVGGEEKELDLTSIGSEGREEGDEEEGEWEDVDKKEAREMYRRLRQSMNESESDPSCSIPTRHLSLSPSILLPRLHTLLYILRLTLLSSLRSTTHRIELSQLESQEALAREIEVRDQEIEKREFLEMELERLRKEVREGGLLVDQFLGRDEEEGGGKARRMRRDSGDELPEAIFKSLQDEDKKRAEKKLLKKSSKLISAEIEKPLISTSSSSSTTQNPRPSIPSQTVQDFLGSLGLDTPIASSNGGEKEVLKSNKVVELGNKVKEKKSSFGTNEGGEKRRTSATSSNGSKDSRASKETFRKPSVPKTTSSNRAPASSTTTNVRTSPSPPATTEREESPSAALQSILSLALSPPGSSEHQPLVSSQLAATKQNSKNPSTSTTTTMKPVLGSSRALNNTSTLPSTTTAGTKSKSREELIKDKKASLILANQQNKREKKV